MRIVKTLFILLLLPLALPAQQRFNVDSIENAIAGIEQAGRLVEAFIPGMGKMLPIGIQRTIGNVRYTVAISEIRSVGLGPDVATMFLRIYLPDQPAGRNKIYFAASGIELSREGGLQGDVKLALIAPFTFSIGNDIDVTLLGAMEYGAIMPGSTSVTVNCYGFKELSLAAEIKFSDRILKPAGGGSGNVTTRFQTTVADWNDILVDISIPPFEIPGLNDWVFHVENAVIDLSETRASPNVIFPESYRIEYPTAELQNLWRGVYIRYLSVALPNSLTANQGSPVTIRGSNFLIDRRGFSGTLSASPVFSLNQGDAGGWPFSMDNLFLEFDRNRLVRGEFSGELILPVSETPLRYTGMLSLPNNYALTVAITDTMNFDLWRLATVRLDANSSVSITYDNSSRTLCFSDKANGLSMQEPPETVSV